jgi:alcohol oxidase
VSYANITTCRRHNANGGLFSSFPGDPSLVPQGQYFGIATFSLYPFSRGHIHIIGADIDAPPDFDLGFLADPQGVDIKKHVWVYKKHREIIRRMDTYRGEISADHPPFPSDSNAVCGEIKEALGRDVPDVEYSEADDWIIEQWIRQKVDTTWHSPGTCKMLPRERFGVIDDKLSVYGVDGLKVADLSIPPSNVGANTNNTAMAIGEKASDIFIQELGLTKN